MRSGGKGAGGPDGAAHDDVGEAPVQVGQLGLARLHLQPQHQQVAHPAARVVVAVEAEDLLGSPPPRVGDLEEGAVLGRDQPAGDRPRPRTKRCQPVPVGAAGRLEHDHRRRLGLARLQQGEQLERLVQGAEAAGEDGVAVGLLDEHELAGEEVPHLDQLGVLGDEGVGPLLVGAGGC